MPVQEANSKTQVAGHCADCGLLVEQRIAVWMASPTRRSICATPAGLPANSGRPLQAGAADRRGKLCRPR